MRLRRSQRGDTIVEVLIAIAIVSSVLGVTYGAMNRNLLITRANQERTEASKIAQGQLEAIRGLTAAQLTTIAGNSFCIINGMVTYPTNGTVPATNINSDVFANYGSCKSDFYNFVIKKFSGETYKYQVYVRWDKIGGDSREQIIMSYRI
jgi:prepilin-type N-terminal cleavage/methylation domain-containing protein